MEETPVTCPYCGEEFTIVVDCSQPEQSYIEDCFVCCRPIQFHVRCEDEQVTRVDARRD